MDKTISVSVPISSQVLTVVKGKDGINWCVFRYICKALGIDTSGQWKSIKDKKTMYIEKRKVGTKELNRDAWVVKVDEIQIWLDSLDLTHFSPTLRTNLIWARENLVEHINKALSKPTRVVKAPNETPAIPENNSDFDDLFERETIQNLIYSMIIPATYMEIIDALLKKFNSEKLKGAINKMNGSKYESPDIALAIVHALVGEI